METKLWAWQLFLEILRVLDKHECVSSEDLKFFLFFDVKFILF
jgi:hypothetical protein